MRREQKKAEKKIVALDQTKVKESIKKEPWNRADK
jgi:hypothetical protein